MIVANFNGKFICNILNIAQRLLVSANSNYEPITINEYDHFTMEGVVIRSIALGIQKFQPYFKVKSLCERITCIENLNQALAKHVAIAALKARQQRSLCGTLMAFAANSPFDDSPCSYKLLKQFTPPTNDTTQILKVISDNMHQLYKSGGCYYKIGIRLLDLSSEAHQQGDLFSPPKDNIPLMNVVDKINDRYGSNTTFFAAQGIDEQWSMRRSSLTPQYTTNWKHLPKFIC